MKIIVLRNDGIGDESNEVEVDIATSSWDEVKMTCAQLFYTETDLFCISGADDIKLYLCPNGEDPEEGQASKELALDTISEGATFAVDIFGSPFQKIEDLLAPNIFQKIEDAIYSARDDPSMAGIFLDMPKPDYSISSPATPMNRACGTPGRW